MDLFVVYSFQSADLSCCLLLWRQTSCHLQNPFLQLDLVGFFIQNFLLICGNRAVREQHPRTRVADRLNVTTHPPLCWSAAPPSGCPPHSPPGSLRRRTCGSGSTSPACSSLWGRRRFPVPPPPGGNILRPSRRPQQTETNTSEPGGNAFTFVSLLFYGKWRTVTRSRRGLQIPAQATHKDTKSAWTVSGVRIIKNNKIIHALRANLLSLSVFTGLSIRRCCETEACPRFSFPRAGWGASALLNSRTLFMSKIPP